MLWRGQCEDINYCRQRWAVFTLFNTLPQYSLFRDTQTSDYNYPMTKCDPTTLYN